MPIQNHAASADTEGMRIRHGVLSALLVAACTSPAQSDTARLPPVTTGVPTTTTTVPPPPTTTSTTTAAPGPDIVAWLAPDAPVDTLGEALGLWEGVASVTLVTGTDALAEFEDLFADRPGLTSGVPAEALPSSLRIELEHPSHLGTITAQLRSLSGITEVATAVTPACNPFADWNVIVFVEDDRQLTRLHNDLVAIEGLADVDAVGRQEAFDEFRTRFPGVAVEAGIGVQDMSVSLRARSDNPVALSFARTAFRFDQAVKGVQVFNPGAPGCP